MPQITQPSPQLPIIEPGQRDSWLAKLRDVCQRYFNDHARSLVIIEGTIKQVYTIMHDENAGAVTGGTSDWQAVVLESGKLKRVGAVLRAAGGANCVVQFRVNTVVVATVTVVAGQLQATSELITPREVVVGNQLDLNVTAASGTALVGEFGVA
jgi:hypothetical protein